MKLSSMTDSILSRCSGRLVSNVVGFAGLSGSGSGSGNGSGSGSGMLSVAAAITIGVAASVAVPQQAVADGYDNPTAYSVAGSVAGSAANTAASTTVSTTISSLCSEIEAKLPVLATGACHQVGLQHTGGYSVLGRPIAVKDFSPKPELLAPRGRVLILGGVHGDERSSVEQAFKWIQLLDKQHNGLFHWRVVPVMNPDGFLAPKSTRVNHNGVDLNRNMSVGRGTLTPLDYWTIEAKSNPRRYPGSAPMSEPETQWLVSEIETFKPDAIVAIHAPLGMVDFDGPHNPPMELGPLRLRLLGAYPGSLGNYAGVQRHIPVMTIELSDTYNTPDREYSAAMWADMVRWLRRNVNESFASAMLKQ